MPNVENILKVADAIEQHAISELGFNMSLFVGDDEPDLSGHNCGTTACIGGWAAAVATGDIYAANEMSEDQIGSWLGLDPVESSALFYAFNRPSNVQFEDITPQHAVTVLRRLADTGRVDWSAIA